MEQALKRIFAYAKKKGFNEKRLKKAYTLACDFHKGQTRKSGEPYISHVIAVTEYLTEYNADEETLISGLLHDAVEDTSCTIEDIEKHFGKNVANLIDGMTKFGKKEFQTQPTLDQKIESLRKWFQVMQKDIRVAIIKLFDRLHNMETLGHHGNPQKEKKIAKETLDIHVKIATKLGLYRVKDRLEALCLPYTNPEHHELFQDIQQEERTLSKKILPVFERRLKKVDTQKVVLHVEHEPLTLSDIYELDLHAKEKLHGTLPVTISILTKTVEDCYYILYLLHTLWRADNKGFKDYINSPAQSGYQGLHTLIHTKLGREIIVKIRTEEMHAFRKKGITLFCFQKKFARKKLPTWISHLPHVVKEDATDSQNFWEQLQNDILEETITVYTNKGSSLLLPANSTILDAVFYSNHEKGLYIESVYINGNKAPLYEHLHAYDSLYFTFAKTPQVHYEWFHFIDTALAASYIRQGLDTYDDTKKIAVGKRILQKELAREGKGFIEELDTKKLKTFLDHFRVKSTKQLYKKITEGHLDPHQVAQFLYTPKKSRDTQPKILLLKGSLQSVNLLLDHIPEELHRSLRWSIKNKKEAVFLKLVLKQLTDRQWRNLRTLISRNTQLSVITEQNYWNYLKLFFYVPLINVLWGLDPIVASELLKTSLTPHALTVIRFCSVTVFFFVILGLGSLNSSTQKQQRSLPFFTPYLFLLSILLFGIAYSTYMSVSLFPASDYLLCLRFYGIIILGHALLQSKYFTVRTSTALSMVLLGYITFFVFEHPLLESPQRFWIVLASGLFALYSYISKLYRSKLKVLLRYYQMQFRMVMYAAILGLATLYFVPLPALTPQEIFAAIIFSCVFTAIPYLLFFRFLKHVKDKILISSFYLAGAFFVGIFTEFFLYGLYPGPAKTLSIVFIFGGLLTLFLTYKQLQESPHLMLDEEFVPHG